MQKKYLLIILFILLGIVIFFAGRIGYVYLINKNVPQFKPQVVKTTLQPPAIAIQAQVINITPTVKKQGREDAEFKPATKSAILLQGESIATEKPGSCTVSFGQNISANVAANSQLDFLNALPKNLVIRQPNGTITYTVSGTIPPFSIRSLGLLTQFKGPTKTIITTNPTTKIVVVRVISGSATLAHNDDDYVTHVENVSAGQEANYDYANSTLDIQ